MSNNAGIRKCKVIYAELISISTAFEKIKKKEKVHIN
jgi:hypothetical protein